MTSDYFVHAKEANLYTNMGKIPLKAQNLTASAGLYRSSSNIKSRKGRTETLAKQITNFGQNFVSFTPSVYNAETQKSIEQPVDENQAYSLCMDTFMKKS